MAKPLRHDNLAGEIPHLAVLNIAAPICGRTALVTPAEDGECTRPRFRGVRPQQVSLALRTVRSQREHPGWCGFPFARLALYSMDGRASSSLRGGIRLSG